MERPDINSAAFYKTTTPWYDILIAKKINALSFLLQVLVKSYRQVTTRNVDTPPIATRVAQQMIGVQSGHWNWNWNYQDQHSNIVARCFLLSDDIRLISV